jgi:hypothetical protein
MLKFNVTQVNISQFIHLSFGTFIVLDKQHKVVDKDWPAIRISVFRQVAFRHIIELDNHSPRVRVDRLLFGLGQLLEILHKLIIKNKVTLQI